ncbi:MAG: 2-C-methyl-D-erythritol 2,4-cyclodiphosphate synthase [Paludibacteraceae bacterium]|nr:2-C-methyl-D-erythritol 2,4-cyclodiphosphate synthase [Paludibacteraceae bacterium]
MRIGFGYDVHQFSPDRKLWLGGIEVPSDKGLLGHSDADVLIHALCDALLGAAGLRDIGYHFPDTKGNEYEGIDSKILLRKTMTLLRENGYTLGNCDCTVCAQAPKLSPFIPAMQECLAKVMEVNLNQVSVKATTTEHLGFVGREEGIAAYAVVLITENR